MNKRNFFLSACGLAALTATAQVNYPETRKCDTVDTYFGTRVQDPYRWLEDDTSQETAEWVDRQTKFTSDYISKIPFREKLLRRLRQVSNYERIGTPFFEHGRWYVYRNNGLQNQYVLYTMDKLGGEEKVFLDPNALSSDGTVALKSLRFSNDGRYAAYVISRNGSDWQEIYVRDVATGKDLTDHLVWCKFSDATWRGDGFYYMAYDAPEEGHETSAKNEVAKIYYHKIGTPQSADRLFYQDPAHPQRFNNVSVNAQETVMYMYSSGWTSGNTLSVRDLRQPDSQFISMTPDAESVCGVVETIGDSVYILTNAGAPRYRLMVADIKNPGFKDWKEVVAESEDVLEDVSFSANRIYLTYMKDNCSRIVECDLTGRRIADVDLPGVGSASLSAKRTQKEVFYNFTSYTVPSSVYSYDAATHHSSLWAAPKVNFNLNAYITEMVFYTSKDGTRAPLFLTYKKGMKRNGKAPLLLYGYGGFNVTYTPSFSASRIPFLESGGIYAYAVLRGGGEYGEAWHQAGTKMNKQNVFDDFIAAAEFTIAQKYTSKERLAIIGGSNGGLLVGACLTQRPDLYKVCIAEVGVMDMLRYHRFTIGWNWAPDYGTSADSKEMFDYLHLYSPLHALKPGTSYPATLITTADHDDRVVPAHSFKFAARMQECQSGKAPVLIRIDKNAGHGGGKPLSKQLEETADIYSFILYNMGLKY